MIRPPILVFLGGSDRFARQHEMQRLITQALDPEWREYNLEQFEAHHAPGSVIDAWLTPPFWGHCRVLTVELPVGEAQGPLLDALATVCEQGLPQTDNLLILMSDNFDKRRKATKALLAYGVSKDFQEIKTWNIEKELYPWIENEVRNRERRISREAVVYLAQACGTDKFAIHQALDKVMTFLGDVPFIDLESLKLLVSSTDTTVFQLLDLLAARQKESVFQHLQSLLQQEPAPKVLFTIATQMSKIFRARWQQSQGFALADIAQDLGLKPFALEQMLKRWRHYSQTELQEGVHHLLHLQMRTRAARAESVDPAFALELWLGQMLRL